MIRSQRWRDRAACQGLPMEWFFPAHPKGESSYDHGKRVCATCPVTAECFALTLDFVATGDRYGLFGGKTPAERRFARRVELNIELWK